MLWSFLTWFFKPFGELCLALRDTKWPSTSPFGSPDTTLQHLKSPAGHCSKVCFHLGSEANLMCFKVTLHLLGGSQYMGNMLTYKMNRRTVESWNILILFGKKKSKHVFVAKLGMTRLFETPESTHGLEKEGQLRIPPSIAPLVKLQQNTLTSHYPTGWYVFLSLETALAAAEVPKDSPIANHEELEEFPKKRLHHWESPDNHLLEFLFHS